MAEPPDDEEATPIVTRKKSAGCRPFRAWCGPFYHAMARQLMDTIAQPNKSTWMRKIHTPLEFCLYFSRVILPYPFPSRTDHGEVRTKTVPRAQMQPEA